MALNRTIVLNVEKPWADGVKARFRLKLNEVLEVKDDDYHHIEIQSNTELEYIDTSEERNHDIKNDYEFRREKLYQLVSKGEDALENLLVLAKESDHPRAYEVFGQLMKANMDAVKDLTDLQKDMNKIESTKKVYKILDEELKNYIHSIQILIS